MATENKYKKGDWVRCIDNSGATGLLKMGAVYEVDRVNDVYIFIDGIGGMTKWRFEPWRPKVGERVRWSGKGENLVAHWNTFWRREQGEYAGSFVVVKTDKYGANYSSRADGAGPWASFDYLKPVTDTLPVAEQPAALTIQVGRYYKTRDGRKVGPMVDDYSFDCVAFIEKSGDGRGWSKFGVGLGLAVGDDLIAEWVDAPAKPTTNLAATVDAINDEYGPVVREVPVAAQQARFKVGDRVECTAGLGRAKVKDVRPDGKFRVDWDSGDIGWQWWGDMDFTLVKSATPAIVCKIDNGQPLPATRPAVHATVEAADAEAKRLANLHTGQEFGVYALTGTPHRVAKVYEHEWQRLAAEGNENAAVASLVKSSGIGPGPAVIAVRRFAA